ncbi:MAG: hypothetical protein QWI73_05720 [Alphaproteobacteria bacterium]|nr:hypothetical protein [Alphaproteobacteria bacterium]
MILLGDHLLLLKQSNDNETEGRESEKNINCVCDQLQLVRFIGHFSGIDGDGGGGHEGRRAENEVKHEMKWQTFTARPREGEEEKEETPLFPDNDQDDR